MCSVSHIVRMRSNWCSISGGRLGPATLVVLASARRETSRPAGRRRRPAARGFWVPTSETSIEAKPCSAFVTRPEEVWMSVGSAKKARKASDIPSSRTSGRWSAEPQPTNSPFRIC